MFRFKFRIFTLSCFLLEIGLQAQNNADYPVKEQYDFTLYNLESGPHYSACDVPINAASISNDYGDYWSYIMESELRMYETTMDKAYLIKFVLDAICIHEHRRDEAWINLGENPTWACEEECDQGPSPYHDGSIIWPMSHFVHLVRTQQPWLLSEPLPQLGNTKISFNNFGAVFLTYGDFSEWLRVRTEQTLDYYLYTGGYWIDSYDCISAKPNDGQPMQINQQAGFGCALFYLGVADPNTDYIAKALNIASRYSGTTEDESNCDYVSIFDVWVNYGRETRSVMELDPNDSYIWQSSGWQPHTCAGQHSWHDLVPDDYEDLSHGYQTLRYPVAVYRAFPNTWFEEQDMIRYRNTFSYNIFGGYDNGCPIIHPAVDGDDYVNYEPSGGYDGVNNPRMVEASMQWMYFALFDDESAGTNVYDIVMQSYACEIMNEVFYISHSNGLNGLAEVTSAQWANECVNVTFYNRDLTYNQDFAIKNRLSILPEASTPYHQPGSPSFADPVITANEFIIEPNVTSYMSAGEEIILGPGFIAKEGSNFVAYINPSACTDGQRLGQPQPPGQIFYVREEVKRDSAQPTKFSPQLTVVPNPSNGETTLQFSLAAQGHVTLVVTDLFGRVVFNDVNEIQSEPGNYSVPVNVSEYATGMYACNLYVDGMLVDVKRMVVK